MAARSDTRAPHEWPGAERRNPPWSSSTHAVRAPLARWLEAQARELHERLGPYRLPEDRKDNRARDLAAMARAGFAYDVAKKVIDAPSPDALDEP